MNHRHELHAAIVFLLAIILGIYAVSLGGHIQADATAIGEP